MSRAHPRAALPSSNNQNETLLKKLINDPRSVVREMLEGLVDSSGHLALVENENIVVQRDLPQAASRKVAIISGGGSGHEPAHAGYVGEGMLTAAVAGDVFTSPSVDAILAAILTAAGPAGALLVVKNYTGDRLNFGLAAELARDQGIPVEIVVVADDVSLRGRVSPERRRGIAGTVLVHKVAGAAAAQGKPLHAVAALATQAAHSLASIGVGLGSCTVPAAGTPSFTLADDEIELGLGIHGEKGVRRDTMKPADAIVDDMLEAILTDLTERPQPNINRIALMVNGLGGTPPMELQIVARRALAVLRERGFHVERVWVGNYMTALEMPGCSLTILPVDDATLTLLDAPAQASGWQAGARVTERITLAGIPAASTAVITTTEGPLAPRLKEIVLAVADALEAAEAQLTDLDSQTGDGDLGASLARGAQAMRALPGHAFHAPDALLLELGKALRRAIAGSSGPFYATALVRAARHLNGMAQPSASDWQAAFAKAAHAISEIGGAKTGDRSMYDALASAADEWQAALAQEDSRAAFNRAAEAAERGAQQTASMLPRLGRASYLGERALGIPDGGAVAVAIWLRAIAQAISK